MSVFLVGGGPETVLPGLLAPFLAEAAAAAARSRRPVRLVLAVFDHRRSGRRFLPAYRHALDAGRDVAVQPVYLRRDEELPAAVFDGAAGIVVGGGPTPEYLAGLTAAAPAIAAAVGSGTPYLGFSAGAMIAPGTALVGGYRLADRDVCPEDGSEELDELSLRPGLGLIGFPVDVHTAQAGTLGRVVALVASGAAPTAVGIDEDTCLVVPGGGADPARCTVTGRGAVWTVRGAAGSVEVVRTTAAPA